MDELILKFIRKDRIKERKEILIKRSDGKGW